MTELENLHLALFDMAMAQKELHCDMLLAGHFEAADNAWMAYQRLKPEVDRCAQLVAELPKPVRVRKFAGC